MPIGEIKLIPNKKLPKFKPVKENMNIFIPDIINGVPNRNGFIWVICGAGGSGKSSMMLNFFSTDLYREKFHNIFYFCPEVSFLSVHKHPFAKHNKVYHDLNVEVLKNLYSELKQIKMGEDEEEDSEEDEVKYNLVIFDDYADAYKSDVEIQKILSTMLIKARHLNTAFIFTLQSYMYYPKILRKQVNFVSIFKSRNIEEWESIAKELIALKKDDALKLYDYIFDAPYTHIDIDLNDNKYYKNFHLLEFSK
jgi:predicted adenine nucleotide alpha hydrolase (AANH) superfamily ATPase